MTTDPTFLLQHPNRCPQCFLETHAQGHRSHIAGEPTGCDNSGPLGTILGRQLAQQGMTRTVDAHPSDAALVDSVLEARIRRGGEFSLNDLRADLSAVESKSVIGARVNAFARSKRIVRVGYVPSTDPRTHGHPIVQWRVAA